MKSKTDILASGVTPILNVTDFKDSIRYYTEKLLFTMDWEWGDPPQFGSVSLDQASIFLCEKGQGNSGTWISLFVDDVDLYCEKISSLGAHVVHGPKDEVWGCREMHVKDLDDHVIRFTQSIPEREPKIEIERTELTPRVESRLAALLLDLAKHKKMELGELMEETFLHSFEKVSGEGVANPHTRSDELVIEELKRKHGIDYDTHANYRFREAD